MRDPSARPAPRLGDVITLLAEHEVRWVLTGSFVLAACGAPIVPNDVDVTPALDPANLVRLARALEAIDAVPAYVPGSPTMPSLEDCLAWKPTPSEAGLDHLLVTSLGMVDVVPRLCGLHDELVATAVVVDLGSAKVTVCDPSRVLRSIDERTRARAKDVARDAAYSALRAQPSLAVQPALLARLASL